MDLTVVIPTRNKRPLLQATLVALQAQGLAAACQSPEGEQERDDGEGPRRSLGVP